MVRGNKYHAKKVELDGWVFDSQAEAARYQELMLLARAGEITDLRVHPRYPVWSGIVKRKAQYIEYEADFVYLENGREVAEDVKGVETDVFKIKAKLFQAAYPEIEFRVLKVR